MSYVDEVIGRVVKENPNEPEFHQAVKKVLDSLRPVKVDAKLKCIMVDLYHNIDEAAKKYGFEGNFVVCANIAGFEKVVDAMNAQGIV